MKNFSTVGNRLVTAALFAVASVASAAPLTCEFRADAPDQHVVVKGDTLWDISGSPTAHREAETAKAHRG